MEIYPNKKKKDFISVDNLLFSNEENISVAIDFMQSYHEKSSAGFFILVNPLLISLNYRIETNKNQNTSFDYILDFQNYKIKDPVEYAVLSEDELNPMLYAYSEKSLSEDWDIDDEEQNDYWNSFK